MWSDMGITGHQSLFEIQLATSADAGKVVDYEVQLK